jgi:hypothetical protein
MGESARRLFGPATSVLLIESDCDRRSCHQAALEDAGYRVIALPGVVSHEELTEADVILADHPAFECLQRFPGGGNVIVVTDDVKIGVTACLCGPLDWVPVNGAADYLTEAVRDAVARRTNR